MRTRPVTYLYGKYVRDGDPTVDENFFPIMYTDSGGRVGARSPFLERYCDDATLLLD